MRHAVVATVLAVVISGLLFVLFLLVPLLSYLAFVLVIFIFGLLDSLVDVGRWIDGGFFIPNGTGVGVLVGGLSGCCFLLSLLFRDRTSAISRRLARD